MPTSTWSQRRRRPSASVSDSTRPLPAARATSAPVMTVTPCRRCRPANHSPIVGPSSASIGARAASTIVVSAPALTAAAATSCPMKPPPTITRRLPSRSTGRSAWASSTVRNAETLSNPSRSGSVRGRLPVAIRSRRYRSDVPLERATARAAGSRPSAATPTSRSISCSSYHTLGRNETPWSAPSLSSSAFDSGGRSYGRCGSAQIMRIGPS